MTSGLDPAAAWECAMRRGDFAAAWAVSDAVLRARASERRDDPRLPYHRRWVWDGRRFDGKDVLVRCYHGLGDTLQFARFLPLLRRRVARLTLEAQPELLALLRTLPGPDRLLPFRPAAPAPPAQCDLEIMEIPHALRATPAEAPQPPYLGGGIARVQPGGGLPRLGLCWSGGDWDRARALPLAALASALPPRPVELFSLQRGPASLEAEAPGAPMFRNAGDRSTEILATASLIASLDLVITVDTMVAHLAGALGRPVALLLKSDADWRWMEGRSTSPWYPWARLYRQQAPGDWGLPLAALRDDLARWLGHDVAPGGRACRRSSAAEFAFPTLGS